MRSRLLPIPLFALLVLAPGAAADVVHLDSGGRVVGKATRSGDEVLVETVAGETRFPASRVARIDFDHEAPIEEYRVLEQEAESDPARRLELAVWAREHRATRFVGPNVRAAAALLGDGDAETARELAARFEKPLRGHLGPFWTRLLELDPSSERARRALGYRWHDDRWLTEEEFQAAQGRVRFEGGWMTPGERELILERRKADFEERERDLRRAEERLGEREEALEEGKEQVRSAKRKLTEIDRELKRERRRLEDWEEDLEEREERLRRLRFCRQCGAYYPRNHICPSRWFHCSRCNGWFPRGHRCPR